MWIVSLLDGRVVIRLDVQPPQGDPLHGWWNLPQHEMARAELMLLRDDPGTEFRVVKCRDGGLLLPDAPIISELRDVIGSIYVHPERSRLGLVHISENDQVLLRLMAEPKRAISFVTFKTRYRDVLKVPLEPSIP